MRLVFGALVISHCLPDWVIQAGLAEPRLRRGGVIG